MPLDYGSHALKPESWGALWKAESSIGLTREENGEQKKSPMVVMLLVGQP